jgi:Na+-driven multidrug efflux pump
LVGILAVLEIAVMMGLNNPILNAMSSSTQQSTDPILGPYYQKVHDLQIHYASIYTMFLTGLLLLTMFVFYFSTLIKSEGRFKVAVIASVICNILNIALVVIFIYVIKVGIVGAGIAASISYFINIVILIAYIKLLSKHKTS